MLQLRPKSTIKGSKDPAALKTRQSHKLLLALALLVVAIAVVVVGDRQFWFGPEPLVLDSDGTEPAVGAPPAQPTPRATQPSQPSAAQSTQPAPAPAPSSTPVAKKHIHAAKGPVKSAVKTAPKAANSPTVATTRTVLPPMDVDVVAGDGHQTVRPANKAAKVEILTPNAAPKTGAVTNAIGRERISSDAAQSDASYPLLAQNMNVQGSVVLQAIIGADGIIENVHVLSGPAILAAAAQQAVREWRFKPVLQNGQPVETKANITVNFTIKVADSTKNS